MNYIGKKVYHKIFGEGVVSEQDSDYIYLKFSSKDHSIGYKFPEENWKEYFQFINEEEIETTNENIITSVIDLLAFYIGNNKIEKISKFDLFQYALKMYFKPNYIEPIEISSFILNEIVKKLIYEYKIDYILEKDTIFQKFYFDQVEIIEKKKKSYNKNSNTSKSNYINKEVEILYKASYVSELIKSFLISSDKSFYSLYDLKNGLINTYKKNPQNLITRELLIKLCKELYEEDHKYYYVLGDGNSLMLCKAKSIKDWQNYGLGTVFNPTVQVGNNVFFVKDFVLYVYSQIINQSCVKSDMHKVQNVTIKTIGINGYPVSFNAYYCTSCKKYFTTRKVIENDFPNMSYPFIRLSLQYSNSSDLNPESILKIYGYSVQAGGPSDAQRESLLAKLMAFNIVSKSKIESLITYFINFNGKKKNMENAIAKWSSDLEFVQNYNLNIQKCVSVGKMIIK